jgi:hypothetical protein
MNPGFSEYEAGVLTTRPWRSFIFSLTIMFVLLHKLVTFLIMFACFVSDVGQQCSKREFRNVGILLKNETRIYRQRYRYVFLEKRSAGMKFRNKNKFGYGITAYRPTGPFRALVLCSYVSHVSLSFARSYSIASLQIIPLERARIPIV